MPPPATITSVSLTIVHLLMIVPCNKFCDRIKGRHHYYKRLTAFHDDLKPPVIPAEADLRPRTPPTRRSQESLSATSFRSSSRTSLRGRWAQTVLGTVVKRQSESCGARHRPQDGRHRAVSAAPREWSGERQESDTITVVVKGTTTRATSSFRPPRRASKDWTPCCKHSPARRLSPGRRPSR